jgi:hypothetical protein
MGFGYLAPAWFFGVDVIFQLIFGVITLLVAVYAFHIYKVTEKRQLEIFGLSFLLISISYLIQSLFNFLVLSKLDEGVCNAMKIPSVALFNTMGVFAHMIFMTGGLVLLGFMTFKTSKIRIFWLMLASTLLAVLLSLNHLYVFYVMTSVFLLFIAWHFIENYSKKKQTKTLLVAIAFVLLLLGRMQFVLALNDPMFYVIGHVLELFAYLFILWNFLLVRKR